MQSAINTDAYLAVRLEDINDTTYTKRCFQSFIDAGQNILNAAKVSG